MIRISMDQAIIHAGGILTGRVNWSGDRQPNRIIVAAQWESEGAGNKAWGVGRSMVFTPPQNAREAMVPVRLMIPHEGPVSFTGTLLAIRWTLKVRVDQPGDDEYEECDFRVEPRKRAAARG